MDALRNCPICFKLFSFDGELDLCPECAAKDEQDYLKVRRYVLDNPGATPTDVVDKTGVGWEVIFRLLRNSRLKYKLL